MYDYIVDNLCNDIDIPGEAPIGVLAIMYNQNHALRQVLHHQDREYENFEYQARTLSDAARHFNRYECLDSLLNTGFYAQPDKHQETNEKQCRL